MEYLYPLNAIHIDGEVLLLYTYDEVKNFARKHGKWSESHVDYYYNFVFHRFVRERRNIWIVRDDRGRKVNYDDIIYNDAPWQYYNRRRAAIRKVAQRGLPIPGTGCHRAGWKMNHTAKKNSGSGHRNRNRARFVEDFQEFGIRNNNGKPIPYEHH